MRYIAGYLLAVLGGNENPSTADVAALLSAAGVEVDQALLKLVHAQVAGKSLDELIAAGESNHCRHLLFMYLVFSCVMSVPYTPSLFLQPQSRSFKLYRSAVNSTLNTLVVPIHTT